MPSIGSLSFGYQTDRGMVREENEDACRIPSAELSLLTERGYLFAVADGVGGHGNGQQASLLTLETLYAHYYGVEPVALERAIQLASMAVRRQALQADIAQDRRMSSTLVAALFFGTAVQIAHVGDSRAYLIRQSQIHQLTNDHSLVQEQVAAGLISAEEARSHQRKNVITRAMGADSAVQPDISLIEQLYAGDVLVLCSDGLTNHVPDETIAQVASQYMPEQAVQLLVQLANQQGGLDNITVEVIRFDPIALASTVTRSRRRRLMLWLVLILIVGLVIGLITWLVLIQLKLL